MSRGVTGKESAGERTWFEKSLVRDSDQLESA